MLVDKRDHQGIGNALILPDPPGITNRSQPDHSAEAASAKMPNYYDPAA